MDKRGNVIELEKSDFYKTDLIGLRFLNENGRVAFVAIDGDHLDFDHDHLVDTFVPFLMQ